MVAELPAFDKEGLFDDFVEAEGQRVNFVDNLHSVVSY